MFDEPPLICSVAYVRIERMRIGTVVTARDFDSAGVVFPGKCFGRAHERPADAVAAMGFQNGQCGEPRQVSWSMKQRKQMQTDDAHHARRGFHRHPHGVRRAAGQQGKLAMNKLSRRLIPERTQARGDSFNVIGLCAPNGEPWRHVHNYLSMRTTTTANARCFMSSSDCLSCRLTITSQP